MEDNGGPLKPFLKLRVSAGNLELQILLEVVDTLHVLLEFLVHDQPALGFFFVCAADVFIVLPLVHTADLGLQMTELVELHLEVVQLLPEGMQLVRVKVRFLRQLPETCMDRKKRATTTEKINLIIINSSSYYKENKKKAL